MRRDWAALWSPAIGAEGGLLAYGHHGRPLLVFPSEQGRAHDYESNGMINVLAPLIDAGRLRVYCVDSFDAAGWAAGGRSLDDRAHAHGLYEDWIVNQVVPWIAGDCGGPQEIVTTGCSLGAYHAANFALRRGDLFPLAVCLSGVYDLGHLGGGRGDAFYFQNPMDYVANMHGDHLEWIRGRVSVLLVCGQGRWEDTTGSLESTRRFAGVLAERGIRHELDLWGHDVPHDWPSWRAQIAYHMPRFC